MMQPGSLPCWPSLRSPSGHGPRATFGGIIPKEIVTAKGYTEIVPSMGARYIAQRKPTPSMRKSRGWLARA